MNLTDSDLSAIKGVLWRQTGTWLVLKDAYLLHRQGPPVRIDGDVVIECAKVSFVQVVS